MSELITQKITLENSPNQTFDIILNENECTISVYTKNNVCFFDLTANGNKIASGVKVNFGSLLLSYPFLKTIFKGNFVFLNEDNSELIDFNNFGTITNLYYIYQI